MADEFMTFMERVDQVSNTALGFVAAGVLGGAWWVIRTFFTDRGRLDILERDMAAHIKRTDEWRHDVKDNFDKIDGKLDSIQEALRK